MANDGDSLLATELDYVTQPGTLDNTWELKQIMSKSRKVSDFDLRQQKISTPNIDVSSVLHLTESCVDVNSIFSIPLHLMIDICPVR